MAGVEDVIALYIKTEGAEKTKDDLSQIEELMQSINKAVSFQKTNDQLKKFGTQLGANGEVLDKFGNKLDDAGLKNLGTQMATAKVKAQQLNDKLKIQRKGIGPLGKAFQRYHDSGLEALTRQRIELEKLGFETNEQGQVWTATGKKLTAAQIPQELSKARIEAARLKDAPRGLSKRFAFEFLGIMFFGMQIARVMQSVIKASTSTFVGILEQSKIGGSALQRLSTEFMYLKFTLGAAFDEFLEKNPYIFTFIQYLSDMISNNPEKVVDTLIGIAVAGSAFYIGGQLMLGLNSFLILLQNLGDEGKFNATVAGLDKIKAKADKIAGGIGIGINVYGMYTNFSEDKILAGISDAFGTGTFLALMAGKGKLANQLLIGSIGFELASVIGGETEFLNALRDIGTNLMILGAGSDTPWMINVGVALVLAKPAFNLGEKIGAWLGEKFLDTEKGEEFSENVDKISKAWDKYTDSVEVAKKKQADIEAGYDTFFDSAEHEAKMRKLMADIKAEQDNLTTHTLEVVIPTQTAGLSDSFKSIDLQTITTVNDKIGDIGSAFVNNTTQMTNFSTSFDQISGNVKTMTDERFNPSLQQLGSSVTSINMAVDGPKDSLVTSLKTADIEINRMTKDTIPSQIKAQKAYASSVNSSASALSRLISKIKEYNKVKKEKKALDAESSISSYTSSPSAR